MKTTKEEQVQGTVSEVNECVKALIAEACKLFLFDNYTSDEKKVAAEKAYTEIENELIKNGFKVRKGNKGELIITPPPAVCRLSVKFGVKDEDKGNVG